MEINYELSITFTAKILLVAIGSTDGNNSPAELAYNFGTKKFKGNIALQGVIEGKVKPENSLAQSLAEHLNINVYAFIRRTNYNPTWNDGGDEKFREEYEEIEDESINGQIYRPHNWDEALWHDNGAYALPRAGDTPKGLPANMYLFRKGVKPTPSN